MRFLGGKLLGSMRGEKEGIKNEARASVTPTLILRIFIRLIQFALGVAVIGLYAQDLDRARRAGKYIDAKWAYAVAIGTWSALFAIVLAIVKQWFFCAIDHLTWFFYLVLFGIFGKMYISEDPEGNKGIIRMKNAVWVDLANMLLWMFTAAWGTFTFLKAHKARTQHTSRAPSHV
ncbi:hypothetical protein BU24DRAFT_180603 [Aaosphaeria arxii CBS 175.79]|uniref:MARVEL domain-containing protein n=1 Tax=Aaosphaeria arxii CBS 175.79 TaxID=1450172 RepID=A0A6A5XQX2_9PLEO|nr:uncharacterized protein BU24DRAFT_180603 [Aaosphaeria arxii CBS 175.79]KAF2015572.1 hypothetical protein BU24DRAFT_180603 [Aaosphaeria arxii CBS 175.79]